jgi:hypothetical protein
MSARSFANLFSTGYNSLVVLLAPTKKEWSSLDRDIDSVTLSATAFKYLNLRGKAKYTLQ